MSKFNELAPRIMRDLMAEPMFGFGLYDAAAIVGNAGAETGGFVHKQEINPTVKGSRGGWGWFQWTGPRRVAFEKWAKRKRWALDSYEAQYSFLIRELLTTEKKAVEAIKAKVKLDDKVVAFEKAFERAGVKHYPARKSWARKALAAYNKSIGTAPKTDPAAPPIRPPAVIKPAPSAPAPSSGAPKTTQSWVARLLLWLGVLPKPAVAPRPVIKYDGYDKTVENIQVQLQQLGYPEVGVADGHFGDKTRSAVRAFSADNGISDNTGEITDAFLAALPKAKPRAVAQNRANTTARDLRQAGNESASAFQSIGWLGQLLGLGGLVGGLNETGVLDSIKGAADTATGTFSAIQGFLVGAVNTVQWVVAHWWLFAIVAGLWIVFKVAKGVLELVVLFRQGILQRASLMPQIERDRDA